MPEDPTIAIRRLLVEGQGVPEGKVTPHARILHDLRVDGDDAGDIFQALHAQFGTDFTELNRQWDDFFSTEGVSPRAMLIGIFMIIICGGASGALTAMLHWPKIAGVVLTFALLSGCGWLSSRWFGRSPRPLTVNGLANIVRSGRWPDEPSEVS